MFRIFAAGVREALQQLEARITAAARQSLGQAAAYAAELARGTTKFTDRSGRLRRGIVRGAKGTYSLFVKTRSRHALFVEDGTRAHPIRAKRRRALRFVVGGRTLFRKSVQHPGTKATHFMRDARDDAEGQLLRFVRAGVGDAIKR